MKIKMLIPAKHAVGMEVTTATGTKVHTAKRRIQKGTTHGHHQHPLDRQS